MNRIEVMWLCCTGVHPVGLVKAYDEIEGRWVYYIGVGDGKSIDEDIEKILALGQKYYSLAAIAGFEEVDYVRA